MSALYGIWINMGDQHPRGGTWYAQDVRSGRAGLSFDPNACVATFVDSRAAYAQLEFLRYTNDFRTAFGTQLDASIREINGDGTPAGVHIAGGSRRVFMNRTERMDRLMRRFSFEECSKINRRIEWKWGGEDYPSLPAMRGCARQLLNSAIDDWEETGERASHYSLGINATCDEYGIHLEFILEESHEQKKA